MKKTNLTPLFTAHKLHQLFFYLTLVFLPTQLGKHFWPEWSIVLGRRVDYLSPTLYLTDIIILFTLGFWAIGRRETISNKQETVQNKQMTINNKQYTRKKIFNIQLILITGVFILINILFSTVPWVSVYKWLKVIEFGLLGFYMIKTKPKLTNLTLALSAGIFYSSILALWQFFRQSSIGGLFWYLGERYFNFNTVGIARFDLCIPYFLKIIMPGCHQLLRPYATSPHPNVLGGFLALTLPLIIYGLINLSSQRTTLFKDKLKKKWYFALSILGIMALISSFSRGAIVVFLTGLVLVFINLNTQNIKKRLFFNTGFWMTIITLFVIVTGLLLSINANDESIFVRSQLNRSAIKIFSYQPLTGTGLGNFLTVLPQHLVSKKIYYLQPVHNIYLLLLSETGVIGVIIFIFLIFSFFKIQNSKFKIISTDIKNRNNLIKYIPLFQILIIGLIDHYPLTLQQGQILMTLAVGLLFI